MRFLFVTYCLSAGQGQAQIGVYKRGLRVAIELANRGHDVKFFCTGRQNFHDALTAEAERKVEFVDFPFCTAAYDGNEANRRAFLSRLADMQPDVVVIGEAPLAGTLLEATLSAVESGIPTVLLDNAYDPWFTDDFCLRYGSMYEGIILCGPTAFHSANRHPRLLQVPPYIDASVADARRFLREEHQLDVDPQIVVLGYDPNVADLGVSLLNQLDDGETSVAFVSPTPGDVQERLSPLQSGGQPIRVFPPPPDPLLFGLLEMARCAVTKGGFMQVSECLALGTPVIGLFYRNGYTPEHLPAAVKEFVHPSYDPVAGPAEVAAARRFLTADPTALHTLNSGGLHAAEQAASYLESIPAPPTRDAEVSPAHYGFTDERVLTALRALEGGTEPVIQQVRSSHLRVLPDHDVHNILCEYSVAGDRRFARLWGRVFRTGARQREEARIAREAGPPRRVLYRSVRARLLIEVDLGEEVLPSIWDLLAAQAQAADHG